MSDRERRMATPTRATSTRTSITLAPEPMCNCEKSEDLCL